METLINNKFTQTEETQELITPAIALNLLLDGNKRFVDNSGLDRDLSRQILRTSTAQYPFAAVLSCIDSRIPTEVVFDQGIGDIFSARIAGNFVNEDILGSLEFACKVAGSKIIVVMGHTSCGAVKGACDNVELGNLTQMLKKIKPAVDNTDTPKGEERTSSNSDFVNRVALENVKLTIARIKAESPILNEMLENQEIDIVGAMYDVASGRVSIT